LLVLDLGQASLPLDIDKVYSIKRNMSQMLKAPNHPRTRYHQCGDFDLLELILSRPKRQLDSNFKDHFLAENEPQLHRKTDDIVIIKDK